MPPLRGARKNSRIRVGGSQFERADSPQAAIESGDSLMDERNPPSPLLWIRTKHDEWSQRQQR